MWVPPILNLSPFLRHLLYIVCRILYERLLRVFAGLDKLSREMVLNLLPILDLWVACPIVLNDLRIVAQTGTRLYALGSSVRR